MINTKSGNQYCLHFSYDKKISIKLHNNRYNCEKDKKFLKSSSSSIIKILKIILIKATRNALYLRIQI